MNANDKGDDAGSGDKGNKGEGMIPLPRFNEVNERMKEAERKLAEFTAAEEKKQREALETKGDYERAKEALERKVAELLPKAQQFDSYLTSRRESLLAGLPDEHRPIATKLELGDLEKYAELHGNQERKPPSPAGVPGSAGSTTPLTSQEIQEGIRKGGLEWVRKNAHLFPGATVR